ncbi:ribonuclease catalytic domain-containing protein [Treponema denticola]|uniref:ribonuclease catalytic domain-containing protein n=1 Tax=Treponema denticola TaxID=158 RepID=UPI002103C944|nr:ribonuclease catalytic domain-containing protein [Treponema denticola]UTY24159.1 RNB domain-containing ribonuclease [Treponema denticola]
MNTNAIVLYKNRPALIKGQADGKFEIETETGIKKVREKDFSVLAPSNSSSLKNILTAACPEPDFNEAADFFEEGTALFSEISELVWENLNPEQMWAAWLLVSASPLFIAESPDIPIKIRTKEEAEAIAAAALKKETEKQAEEQERKEFISSLSKFIKEKKEENFDLKKYSHFLQEIEALALEKTDKSKLLNETHLKETPESAHKILISTGYWKIEKNPYPTRFKHPLNSPKLELPPIEHNKKYEDLTHLTSYAIDNEGSTDPDDAVCFDGENLWIHIANPADIITPDSKSDMDARKRGATLYIPEGVSRMLGESAVDAFALGLHDDSYALSFKLKLNDSAEILDVDILRTKIKVSCISFETADEEKMNTNLKPLFEIAEKNRKKREAAGAVSIDMPEVQIKVETENDNQKGFISPYNFTESFLMIKEMMLLAGEAAARFAFKNNIPFQYVSQEAPELPKKLPEGLAGEYRKRKAMRPRNVGTIPAMHSALGIAMYSQITSPLRRYGDLVAHQQLLKFIDGNEVMKTDDLLMRIAAGDIAGKNCSYAERASRQHWTLIYLLQNPDWQGEAVILETIKNTARISIPSIGYETEMRLKKELSINERINIKAEDIDIPNLTVRFVQV